MLDFCIDLLDFCAFRDITLGIAIGSSTHISMFVIPFCVVIGWMMGQQMDLNFGLFETATLFITIIIVAFMLQVCSQNKPTSYNMTLLHALF
ncbi:hypothetical protein PR202_ga23097 [Eleusine coracana subsp. coracana]|uniref:Sodium/calcium exchanger membrane region domain-containing protein n=1 Tax=Eleusine coracana subsp. coracana TaxID=191504 RepID=A0AAV5D4U1_ELECO|nr:hypothetical protein PR202_ga23097 [Eleusine coracana subsp. coracana]